MAQKTSADWLAEKAEWHSSATAITLIADDANDGAGRALTDEENAAYTDYTEKMKAAQVGYEAALEFESRKRLVAEATIALSAPRPMVPGTSDRGPAARSQACHRIGTLRAFTQHQDRNRNAQEARDVGYWLRAVIARGNRQVDEEAEKVVVARGWDIRNTATEGSPTGGGFLVPTPLSEAIIDVRALAGVSRNLARVMAMTSETQDIPKKTAGTTVYYPGEAQATTASDQTWGNVKLTAKKRAILSKISQELRDDAIISVVDDLASQMGTDFAVKEDAEFFKGDGTSTYGGVTGLLAAQGAGGLYTPANGAGLSVWSGLTNTEITNTMAKLPDKYWQYGCSWACSSVFYFSVMLKLQANAGGNDMISLANGQKVHSYLGYPVFFTNQMPTATATSTVSLLFGAFNQAAIIGDRGGVTIKQSEHLNFDQDVLAVLGTTRYDINCHDVGDASNAGAVVGLKTAAS
jgi:HK97 family phage major capsid protein